MINLKIPQAEGILTIQTLAMPADTNPNGDIFGGWLVSNMDLGGIVLAHSIAKTRVTTIAIDSMVFHKPVQVGDVVSFFALLEKIGRTSLRIKIEAWVTRQHEAESLKVTHGIFTYVAIDDFGKPTPVQSENASS